MKRLLCLLLCLILLSGCAEEVETPTVQEPFPIARDSESVAAALSARGGYQLRAAVLHGNGGSWRNTLDYLQQPLLVNLEAEAVEASDGFTLSGYDVLYLDESLLAAPDFAQISEKVQRFAENGGAVLVPNSFSNAFPASFLGASGFEKVTGWPEAPVFPEGLKDLSELQALIADFYTLYRGFSDIELLKSRDYGVAMVTDTAVPLATADGKALYAVNRFGDGAVLFVNPMLPNGFVQGDFSMEPRDDEQPAFSSTIASCNQLFCHAWAAYASKLRYGFALERVFGAYGSPSMSWALHYEEITGFENDALRQFDQLATAAHQIPSLTLIRNSYWWFARVETMSYLLGTGDTPAFRMDYHENAYSSGTHIDSGGQWLTRQWTQNAGSYFKDYDEYRCRLSPCAADFNGDGLEDFFCGGQDGSIEYYENLGMTGLDGRLRLSEAQPVFDSSGEPIKMLYFSAPAVLDVDGDGALDLLVGGPDGNVLWYRGNGTLTFDAQGILVETGFKGPCLPAVGDIDGDGVPDLALGSERSILLLYFGQKQGDATVFSYDHMASLSRNCADWELGHWLAPCPVDYDEDGNTDLLVGTRHGYVALLLGDGKGGFSFDGYLSSNELDYKGNDRIKFGCFASPLLLDLNGDGIRDLLCGSQEYGMAYPIDSPYFPLREELQSQVDYARDRRYYMGVHFYTNSYASAEREAYELSAHKAAMRAYGLPVEGVGANQHTWYTSTLDPAQSMESLWNAGLLWQSGFAGAGSTYIAPQGHEEAALSLPFYLMDGDERTILMQNCSVLPYREESLSDLGGKYQIPVVVYYHCDMIYRSDQEARNYIQKLSDFQQKFGYNFMREDQLMHASAAAYNLAVDVAVSDDGFTITPSALSTSFPLYDEAAQNACGLRISFADGLERAFTPEARVWRETGHGFSVGLDGPVTLRTGSAAETQHLLQVNLPAKITAAAAGAEIAFTGDGMLQAVVLGNAATADEGWDVTAWDGDRTVFTKFGAADTLHITYMGGNQE